MTNVIWNKPEHLPLVCEGTQELFWIAIETGEGRRAVFPAYYQNRPVKKDEDGEVLNEEDYLVNEDGEPFGSVGWVDCKQHHEFDDFYSPLEFNKNYKMLAWAVYTPPVFISL